ncbi:STAS domain-containing protein [Tichowtungia aerotolerans]|uniref:STAS domain-containing protein n=1 Tax=Tichowtungia aerotolerans TaxID=2697043 RepID=A0A6P1MD85_9BACT|nr:STAS domain-containing protein [Tichowtungia aerotolerans]QHI69556.1 STAS domain-containing protein [Tichowtungia aerotolerans]
MLETEQPNDDLQAAITDGKLFVRVIGRGSFKIAAPMKQFIAEICEKKPIEFVVLDLKQCIGMDSTFMGVLAGLSGRLTQKGQALELINLSEKNTHLLATLGVDRVLSFYNNAHGHNIPDQDTESLPTDQASKKDLAVTALRAHEKLAQISEENKPRFERVIELLKKDVNRLN